MPARILVVEDDPASLELVTYLLSRGGHAVRAVSDGASALTAALENAFDLVLCDLQLPEMSGYDFIGRLHATPEWRRIPVVALTAYSMPGDREVAIAAGFTEYLIKPIDPQTLLDDVAKFLAAG